MCTRRFSVALKILFSKSTNTAMWKSLTTKGLDCLALLLQLAAVVFPLAVAKATPKQLTWASTQREHDVRYESNLIWQIPMSLLFISIKWWENFVSTNRAGLKLADLKRAFHRTRITSSVVVAPLNILISIACLYSLDAMSHVSLDFPYDMKPELPAERSRYYLPEINRTVTIIEEDSPRSAAEYFTSFSLAIVCIGCSLTAVFLASLACKLMMQRVSFALPLVLSSPLLVTLMLMRCNDVIAEVRHMLLRRCRRQLQVH